MRAFRLPSLVTLNIYISSRTSQLKRYCVAPRDIFPDYDRVIEQLRREQEIHAGVEFSDFSYTKVTDGFPQELDTGGQDNVSPGTSSQQDSSEGDTTVSEGHALAEGYKEIFSEWRTVADNPSRGMDDVPPRRSTQPWESYKLKCHPDLLLDKAPLGKRCTYVHPIDRRRCKKVNKSFQEASRHWRSCHLHKEAKAMLAGDLPIGQGTAITSEAQLEEIRPSIQCRYCKALITRSDAMRRHVKTKCKRHYVPE